MQTHKKIIAHYAATETHTSFKYSVSYISVQASGVNNKPKHQH